MNFYDEKFCKTFRHFSIWTIFFVSGHWGAKIFQYNRYPPLILMNIIIRIFSYRYALKYKLWHIIKNELYSINTFIIYYSIYILS